MSVPPASHRINRDVRRLTSNGAIRKALGDLLGRLEAPMVYARHLMPESAQAKKNEKMYADSDPAKRKRERGDLEEKEATHEAKKH